MRGRRCLRRCGCYGGCHNGNDRLVPPPPSRACEFLFIDSESGHGEESGGASREARECKPKGENRRHTCTRTATCDGLGAVYMPRCVLAVGVGVPEGAPFACYLQVAPHLLAPGGRGQVKWLLPLSPQFPASARAVQFRFGPEGTIPERKGGGEGGG
jgi:hypothetical protein